MTKPAAVVAVLLGALAFASAALADPHKVFMASAVENADRSKVTLPLYRGTTSDPNLTGDDTVWYVVTDSSSKTWARTLGVDYAPRLGLVTTSTGAMPVTWNSDGTLDFPATVDFGPGRVLNVGAYGPNETGLPLGAGSMPGAVGFPGYSPLIQLPDGTILNASQVRNATGQADKASDIVTGPFVGRVTWAETAGFFDGHTVHYISVDGSVPPAAILEDVTLAPPLALTPSDAAHENTNPGVSARAGIIAFSNGQDGLGNPNRQGLGSTIVDSQFTTPPTNGATGAPPPVPLNIVQAVPTAGPNSLYSPLWDVHLTRWLPTISAADRKRQTSFQAVEALAAAGSVTNANGAAWGPSGPVANCPIVSADGPHRIDIPPPS